MFDVEQLTFGKVNISLWRDLKIENCEIAISFDENIPLGRTNWISYRGCSYRHGSIVVIKFSFESNSGLPTFGTVIKLLIQHDKPFVLVSVLNTEYRDDHFNAFVVNNFEIGVNQMYYLDFFKESEPLWELKSFANDGIIYICPRNFL